MSGRSLKNDGWPVGKGGFCERKFHSMLLTATFSMAVIFIMLLSDSIIAGYFFGEKGVAAVNAVMPATGVVAFFASIISFGTSILYSREIGAMRKERANALFGQGLIISAAIGVGSSLLLALLADAYFRANRVTGEIRTHAVAFYRWVPVDTFLSIMISYLSPLVYSDGDERYNNLSLGLRIGGNIVLSVLLARPLGMEGITLGSVIGNALGILALCMHFFRRSNTLRFIWHFSINDLGQIARFGSVDAVIYICWAIADYILIRHVSAHYGDAGKVSLAVVMGLTEFTIVLDGIGLAMQPLLETYMGENNHTMIRRLMRISIRTAVIEGLIANALVFAFAPQFCALFGVTGGAALLPSVRAVRIVSMGLVFCSAVSLMTSYYMLVDHVVLSVGITALKDGVLYALLPIIGSATLGENGMWAAFAAAPLLALAVSLLYIRFHYGKARFPHLMETTRRDIVVMDEVLTPDSSSRLSVQVRRELLDHGYAQSTASKASLFIEEIGLTILEKNGKARKPMDYIAYVDETWEDIIPQDRQSTIEAQREHLYQSLLGYLPGLDSDQFDVIIVDEAHHAMAQGFRQCLDTLKPKFLVGMTATPWRGDGKQFTEVFGDPVDKVSLVDGMAMGFLSKVDYRILCDNIDWSELARFIFSGFATMMKPTSMNSATYDMPANNSKRSRLDRKSGLPIPLRERKQK